MPRIAAPRAGSLATFAALTFPFSLSKHGSSSVQDASLLLLGIVGLAATRMEIEEGKIALSVKKLQNIYKHHLFSPFLPGESTEVRQHT